LDFPSDSRISTWAKLNDRSAPKCGAPLTLAPPPDGKGKRTFQCFECDDPDPLKDDRVIGWLNGELGSEN
jgi:hypothetical protein